MIDIEVLRKVQKSLSRYIFAKEYLSWNGIRKACNNIILSLSEDDKEYFKDKEYPEFDIFIPLLRNGTAEVCKSSNRATLLFCMNPKLNLTFSNGKELVRGQNFFSKYRIRDEKVHYKKEIPFEQAFDPLLFLRNYQSINYQITNFLETDLQSSSLCFEQNLMNYQYENKNSKELSIGIFKLDDRAWTTPYLYDKHKKIRKIPYYAEDPDAMNIARLYVRINNLNFKKKLFEYDSSKQELVCNRYSELPILLTRALLEFLPNQLTLKEFCTNHPSIPFKQVPMEAINEIKRIFSDKSVEIK